MEYSEQVWQLLLQKVLRDGCAFVVAQGVPSAALLEIKERDDVAVLSRGSPLVLRVNAGPCAVVALCCRLAPVAMRLQEWQLQQ